MEPFEETRGKLEEAAGGLTRRPAGARTRSQPTVERRR